MRGRISFSEYEDVLSLDALSDSGEEKTTLYSKAEVDGSRNSCGEDAAYTERTLETQASRLGGQGNVQDRFSHWLEHDQHMAANTCRSYASAIRGAERYAQEHGFAFCRLYTEDVEEAGKTANTLFNDQGFIQLNYEQHRRFQAAIRKLLAFYGTPWEPESTRAIAGKDSPQASVPTVDVAPFIGILEEHFQKGYRLDSTLDRKRMRRYYEEHTGKALEEEMGEVEAALKSCGVVYEGKLYLPQNMLDEEMKGKVLSFIDGCFDKGYAAVYYEAVYRAFSEELLDHNIFSAEMLKAYLSYSASDKYWFGKDHLSKGYRQSVDLVDEVRDCLKRCDGPVQVEYLCAQLPHIAEEKVRSILRSHDEFVRNGKGEYFHADSLKLSEEELANIAAIITSNIEEHQFISGNELYDSIRVKYPEMIEKNPAFSWMGWREALKYRCKGRFSFLGNIISKAGASLSMSQVFAEYGRGRTSFSLEELEQFADSIGSTIYFDPLYTHCARVSRQRFVNKSVVWFSVKETDDAIEGYCSGDYIALGKVKDFSSFPDAAFPWTSYLLEQYVDFYSEKFCLMHGSYNKHCAVGAIVRKSAGFASFDDLIADVLARSGIPLYPSQALDYLVERGYIARRSYAGIEALIISARAKRNQKEK